MLTLSAKAIEPTPAALLIARYFWAFFAAFALLLGVRAFSSAFSVPGDCSHYERHLG